jgi:hypothetical protein
MSVRKIETVTFKCVITKVQDFEYRGSGYLDTIWNWAAID